MTFEYMDHTNLYLNIGRLIESQITNKYELSKEQIDILLSVVVKHKGFQVIKIILQSHVDLQCELDKDQIEMLITSLIEIALSNSEIDINELVKEIRGYGIELTNEQQNMVSWK